MKQSLRTKLCTFFSLVVVAHGESDLPYDVRLVAQYLFDGTYSDFTDNGHDGIESGSFFAVSRDPHPFANLLEDDPERGGVYSHTTNEFLYDWSKGGNPTNSRILLEEALPLPNLPANTGITLMAWVKRESVNTVPNDVRSEYGPVIQIGHCGNEPVATLAFEVDGRVAGFIEGAGDEDGQVLLIGDSGVPANEWHHVAISYDRVGDVATSYVDGFPDGVADISVVGDGELDWARAFIAGFCDSSSGFLGRIDDARIYYGALSSAEIQEIVESTIGPMISEFSVSHSFLGSPGDEATLSWTTDGSCELFLEPGGEIEQGVTSMVIMPSETTTYRLVAKNGTATVSRELTVVVEEEPKIIDFAASRLSVRQGERVEFQFEVAGADQLSLSHGVDVNNPIAVVDQTKTFVLTASNPEGSRTSEVTVEVTPVVETVYLVDFGSSRSTAGRRGVEADDGNQWNMLFNYRDGKIEPLVDRFNDSSERISLEVSDGFDGVLVGAAVGATVFTPLADEDGFVTNALLGDAVAELKLSNLDTTGATSYNFTIFAGLTSVILDDPAIPEGLELNLMVQYEIIGNETQTYVFDGADNLDQTVLATGVFPGTDGTIRLSMSRANLLSAGAGLNSLRIDAVKAPTQPEIRLGADASITWLSEVSRRYAVDRSMDLKVWTELTSGEIGDGLPLSWQDDDAPAGYAFYRVRALQVDGQ